MLKNFSRKNLLMDLVGILFVGLFIWWIIRSPFSSDESLVHAKYIWGSFYQLIAFFGGITGLLISKSYGGFKSILGKSIAFFSLGLLFQCLGQTVYSYYNLFADVQAPYPSLGDLGYFGSVVLYIFGAIYLAKASGVRISLKSYSSKIQAFLIPLILLLGSYLIFL